MAALEYLDVILRPVVTEESMLANADGKYVFLVAPRATKSQIRDAVEKLFPGTKVMKVNTMNRPGKQKRRGMVYGRTAATKKAIVTLTPDSKQIEIYSGL